MFRSTTSPSRNSQSAPSKLVCLYSSAAINIRVVMIKEYNVFRFRSPQRSGRVDMAGDSVGRAGGGLHAPAEIVGVGACEVDPAVRFDHRGPEFAQLARSVIHRLAGTGPDVTGPVNDECLLDIV